MTRFLVKLSNGLKNTLEAESADKAKTIVQDAITQTGLANNIAKVDWPTIVSVTEVTDGS